MTVLRRTLVVLVAAIALLVGGGAPASIAQPGAYPFPTLSPSDLSWRLTPTGSEARLRGLAAVSRKVAWASGSLGTVLRTTDGGATWASVGPPGTENLQFRDIEAWTARNAVILSIGSGTDSRIYVTADGGASWKLAFQNEDTRAFYDCMAFTSPLRGIAVSDPVDGAFRFIETRDGGRSWTPVNPAGAPGARPNEFAFAASGQCLTAGQGSNVYLGTGGQDPPKVFVSRDRGQTWSGTEVPLKGGPSAGVFSVQFKDRSTGIAVGGDFADPTSPLGTAAWSADGGYSWQPASDPPGGYRSGSAWLPQYFPWYRDVAIAVGPSGSDVTVDAGRSWQGFDTGSFDTVDCALDGACWASGEAGRVASLAVRGR